MEKSLTLESRDPGQLPEIGTDDHHECSGVNGLSVQLISWDRVSRRQCGIAAVPWIGKTLLKEQETIYRRNGYCGGIEWMCRLSAGSSGQ
jgi:hypothetical protein